MTPRHAEQRALVGDHQRRPASARSTRPSSILSVSPACAMRTMIDAVQLVEIVRMHRLAELEHHVVRDVDDCADRTQSRATQPLLHPERRLRVSCECRESTRLTNFGHAAPPSRRTGKRSCDCGCDGLHRGRMQRLLAQRCDLARDTGDAHAIAAIRREIHFENRVVRGPALRSDPDPACSVRRQIEQSRRILAQAELARRTQHAGGLDAAQLRLLDLHAVRQLRADESRAAPSCRRARSARRRRSAALRARSTRGRR